MGADLYIQTKNEPKLPDNDFCRKHVIEPEKHADEDIEEIFEGLKYDPTKPVYYYRDSYNFTNLAWVRGLSYWILFEQDPVLFLETIAETTDEEIDAYSQAKAKEFQNENINPKELADFLKQKRDYLRAIVEAGIEVITYSI